MARRESITIKRTPAGVWLIRFDDYDHKGNYLTEEQVSKLTYKQHFRPTSESKALETIHNAKERNELYHEGNYTDKDSYQIWGLWN